MAKIEMDVSEYEAMKEKEALLKDALEREKQLNDKVDRLNQEKIEAMEQAKHQVTVIKEVHKSELIHTVGRPDDALKAILRHFGVSSSVVNQMLGDYRRYHGMSNLHSYAWMIDSIFKKEPMETVQRESITRKGFDEVVEEIKDEYNKSMEEDTKQKLVQLTELIKKSEVDQITIRSLEKELRASATKMDEITDNNEALTKKLELLEAENLMIKENCSTSDLLVFDLSKILKEEPGSFGNRKKLNQVRNLVIRAKKIMNERKAKGDNS